MEMEVEVGPGRLRFTGEDEAVVKILEEKLPRVEHTQIDVRAEALLGISSHLDLIRTVNAGLEIKRALEIQLWKEDEPFLIQSFIKVLVALALLPLCEVRDDGQVHANLCKCGSKILEGKMVCEACAKSADVRSRDGVLSSTTSPQKRQFLDVHRKEEKWVSGVEGGVKDQLTICRSIAELLHLYLSTKEQTGLAMKSATRLQILHSLLKIGEKYEGIVTWESLGFVVRRQLSSSNPRVRAMVLRLLAVSVQQNMLVVPENWRQNLATGNVEETEVEVVKRMRVEHSPTKFSAVGAVQGSAGPDLMSNDQSEGLVDKTDKRELNQEIVKSDCPGFDRSLVKVGEILSPSLVEYMKDPYPTVREAAVRALMKLQAKGYNLTSECCKSATTLLRDCFEPVRIAAIELVGLWMRDVPDVKDVSLSKQRTEAFLQVCTMVTDMNMRVRMQAFRVLGDASMIAEIVLLQTLTKKVVTKSLKETDVPVGVSIATPEGDIDLSKFEEGVNLLDASAAGAFVHGLEDEYYEVRAVAIEALARLACKCAKMVSGAVDLLLDMLNDEVEVVRMQAMDALSHLAAAGYLSVHDRHLHLFLGVLEDIAPEMRKGGRDLLSTSHLPSFSIFHSIVRALLTSLEHHPKDEEGVISTLCRLGQTHPTYTECFAQELLQEMQGFLNEEIGLDEPRFAAILSLFLGAGPANPTIISLIPARFLSYASFINHKLPNSLLMIKVRPVGLKTVQFSWLRRNTSQMNGDVGLRPKALDISNLRKSVG